MNWINGDWNNGGLEYWWIGITMNWINGDWNNGGLEYW
jgi:hypothetical protein